MIRFLRQNPNCLLLTLLLLWSVINAFTAGLSELIGDEAYYWVVSQHLDWGFFDHPPLATLMVHIGTMFAGDSELGVRLITVLIQPVYLYIFWLTIRSEKSNYLSVLRYFLLCFSLPLLHVYGFVATPDAPLLLGIVVALWAYKKYVHSTLSSDSGYLLNILLLALGFTIMAYSKYQGALVVIAILIARPKLLLDWRFYAASFITIALYIPHLVWQYNHDFVSFNYHLVGRNSNFKIEYIWEYFVNFFVVYNPFITVPFAILIFRSSPFVKDSMERLYRVLAILVLLFFFISTARGHVQPQWMLPVAFPLIYFMYKRFESASPKGRRYLTITSAIVGAMMLIIQVIIMVADKPVVSAVKLMGKEVGLQRAAWSIQDKKDGRDSTKDVELFITDGLYAFSSLMNFYTPLKTHAAPSIYSRSSHYEFIDPTAQYYGRRVAVEVGHRERARLGRDGLYSNYKAVVVPSLAEIFYVVIDNYIPSSAVTITLESFPSKILTDQKLPLTLSITNPYDFDIPLSGDSKFSVIMHIRNSNRQYWDLELPNSHKVLEKHSTLTLATYVDIPRVETGEYIVGFTLQRAPFASWYNSKTYKLLIVNPKTRV